ncbi:hypothetical protein CO655_14565 [Rhizobium sp. M1]|nr:hypothetical protein CO655_14565 [Rhizobium sp. M1]
MKLQRCLRNTAADLEAQARSQLHSLIDAVFNEEFNDAGLRLRIRVGDDEEPIQWVNNPLRSIYPGGFKKLEHIEFNFFYGPFVGFAWHHLRILSRLEDRSSPLVPLGG